MHPQNLSIKDFTYHLPEEKIAFHPLEKRSDAKLLCYNKGIIKPDIFQNLADHIPANALMVFNNTRVVEARLLFKKESGGMIEIFCLSPSERYADITTAMNETKKVEWLCLIGGASKWKPGTELTLPFFINQDNLQLNAKYLEKRSDCFVVSLEWNSDHSFAEVLHHAGHVPLPPYIKRADELADKTQYQTVFAKFDGSVAAPTAGLHFTPEILNQLEKKGVIENYVTLHVGAGTFKPVKAETMQQHEMHYEFIEVDKTLIQQLIDQIDRPIVAVGTTSLRTLESIYWLGNNLIENPDSFKDSIPAIYQWEPYQGTKTHGTIKALNAVLDYLSNQNTLKLIAKTQIIIAPGYDFKIVNGLVTNFHQPSSTLLLLVAAFVGHNWKSIYQYALENDFRFLSYGDGSLLWR